MRRTRSVLEIAKSKLRHTTKRNCCGCLTPVEFLLLIENGFRLNQWEEYHVSANRELVRTGQMRNSWYVFILPHNSHFEGDKLIEEKTEEKGS